MVQGKGHSILALKMAVMQSFIQDFIYDFTFCQRPICFSGGGGGATSKYEQRGKFFLPAARNEHAGLHVDFVSFLPFFLLKKLKEASRAQRSTGT